MTRLTATNVGHRYGRNTLFRNVSLVLNGGDALAITGANGSGKSTLLQILAGLLTPVAGEVRLEMEGRALDGDEHPLSCGLVAPYMNVYDGFTVRENLRFVARARSLAGATERIDAVVEDVGLAHRADDLVSTFSSGMKQRVKFAVALLAGPSVLLLDEPSTNLDEAGRLMVERLMQRHLDAGGILLLATNDAREARLISESLCVEDFASAAR